jgi:hypothetical protein
MDGTKAIFFRGITGKLAWSTCPFTRLGLNQGFLHGTPFACWQRRFF